MFYALICPMMHLINFYHLFVMSSLFNIDILNLEYFTISEIFKLTSFNLTSFTLMFYALRFPIPHVISFYHLFFMFSLFNTDILFWNSSAVHFPNFIPCLHAITSLKSYPFFITCSQHLIFPFISSFHNISLASSLLFKNYTVPAF